jgi:hypothetical protein
MLGEKIMLATCIILDFKEKIFLICIYLKSMIRHTWQPALVISSDFSVITSGRYRLLNWQLAISCSVLSQKLERFRV